MKILTILIFTTLPFAVFSQKNKVQAAWRALSDYESTIQENPDSTYLIKAKNAIDIAAANVETSNLFKTQAYRLRIYVNLFDLKLKAEEKNVDAAIKERADRLAAAYGNVSILNLMEANSSLSQLKEIDLKKFEKIAKGETDSDDDGKLYTTISQLQAFQSNLASGRYKLKKYDEASDLFKSVGITHNLLTGRKDTASWYNACVCAQKAKDPKRILDCNAKMIEMNIATAYNYRAIYESKKSANDSIGAMEYLSAGRKQFPNDDYLMNEETNSFIKNGQKDKAIENLQTAILKDSKNPVLHFVTANMYDNLANPKGLSGKDTTKPADYEDLLLKAIDHYLKAIEFKTDNTDNHFNALYNLGALYHNYGFAVYSKFIEKSTFTDIAKDKKSVDDKSLELYKKAIPYLEQAHELKPEDKTCINALKTLYYKVGNEAKGNEMRNKLKAKN